MSLPVNDTIIPGIQYVLPDTPLHAQIELTELCNYNCSFCYNVWKNNKKDTRVAMSQDQAEYIAKELIRCRIFSVVFSGGEPTLYPKLPHLVEMFADSGIRTSIISNGALMSTDLAQQLKNAGLRSIQISMHHHKPEICNKIMGHSEAYSLTLSGIQAALEIFGNDFVNVNMVVTKDTTHDVYDMGGFLAELGVNSFSASLVSTCGVAASKGLMCDHKDLMTVHSQLVELEDRMKVAFVGGMPFCALPSGESYIRMANVCDAAMEQIVVSPNGDLRPCVEIPFVAGNIYTDDIVDVWQNSSVLERIRRFENTPEFCRECSQVAHCHGGCRASAFFATKSEIGYDPIMPPIEEIENAI
jgi:radical SAM protein with 4Fe4S-binding SPASM domain